jgi:G protein beta subunit-like protein
MSSVVLATAGYDHTIRFWEATSGICYRTVQYADSQVNKLEITSEKQFIAAAGNSNVKLFEVNSNDPQPVLSYDGHAGNVTAVGFQKDSKWMYTGVRRAVLCAWRVCCVTPLCAHAARARALPARRNGFSGAVDFGRA